MVPAQLETTALLFSGTPDMLEIAFQNHNNNKYGDVPQDKVEILIIICAALEYHRDEVKSCAWTALSQKSGIVTDTVTT